MKNDKPSLRDLLTVLRKSFRVSLRTKCRLSLLFSLLGLPAAFLPVLISKTLEIFSNQIQLFYEQKGGTIGHIILVFSFLASLYILEIAFQTVQDYFRQVDTLCISRFIKSRILENICSVRYKYINNESSYMEKLQLAETVSGTKVAGCLQSVFTWIQYGITFVSIFVVLYAFNPWIVALILITSIPAVILSYKQNDETFMATTRWTKEGHLLIHSFSEMVDHRNLPEIQYLSMMDYLSAQRKETAQKFIKKKRKMTEKHVLYNSAADILRSSVYLMIMLCTAKSVFEHPSLGIGGFMLVYSLIGQFQTVSANLLVGFLAFWSDMKYMQEFFSLDSYEKEPLAADEDHLLSSEISFENVSFHYPGASENALSNVSVTIHSGEKVAIVGENGSGKSTFINLLCGFFPPTLGTIKLGGCEVYENAGNVRQQLSVLFQDYCKYDTSIRDNIIMSESSQEQDSGIILSLCSKLGLDELVQNQRSIIDEPIGTFSESGNNLSGGQWQRVAIARALYKQKSGILILDEPTAALDPKSECEVYNHFSPLTEGKTSILITHRLGAIKLVDRILVFQDGRIIEEGNHSSLMTQNGVYAKMYRAQAHLYE